MTTRPGYVWDATASEWVEIGQAAVVAPIAYQTCAPSSPATGDIWIDSDDDVPSVDSTLYYRWTKTMSGGETSLSGTDNNSLALKYTPGYESVFINGVLQVRGSDYVATTGTTVTGLIALTASDVVMVESIIAYSVGDTYTQAAADTKFNAGYRYLTTLYYTSSGTFTKASYPSLRAIRVKAIGAGGGGGGAGATGASQVSIAGSGGSGGYSEKFYTDIASLSSSITVTVGSGGAGGTSGGAGSTGGDTTFSGITANGGGGGDIGPVGSVTFYYSNPGTGGSSSGGDLNISGSGGRPGTAWASDRVQGAVGGSSLLSGSNRRSVETTGSIGAAGPLYGGGGDGGVNAQSQSARSGGAGAAGIVIVELYA